MPFYNFKCDKCSKEIELICSYISISESTTERGDLKSPCDCGGSLLRQYLNIGLGPDIYKNDPRSNGYWKKGKSNDQIATILNNPTATPY